MVIEGTELYYINYKCTDKVELKCFLTLFLVFKLFYIFGKRGTLLFGI